MNTQRVEGHTPTPWVKDKYGDLKGADGNPVAVNGLGIGLGSADPTWKANGAFVFYAVNNIERLEKVNEALVRALENCVSNMRGTMNETDLLSTVICRQAEATLRLAKEPA